MLQFELSADVRKNTGKGANRGLRRSGKTPAVVYGPGSQPLPLELDTKSFTRLLLNIQRRNAVLTLDIKGDKKSDRRHVIVKEVQSDPISDSLSHADFYEISLEKPVILQVPLEYKGKPRGVDMGGELVISKTAITLKGKILDIPDSVQVDLAALDPGMSLSCSDISIPSNVSLLDRPETVCAGVTQVGT